MHVETLVVGPIQTNCHIVACARTKRAMVVDPGGEPERIVAAVRDAKLSVDWIVNTHGHGDHIAANGHLKGEFPDATLTIHPADAPMLGSPRLNLSLVTGWDISSPAADVELMDGDDVAVGELTIRVIHTPGHTPGGICLHRPAPAEGEAGLLLCGDTLFRGGVGRTDLPGGDMAALIRAIKARLLTLPDETDVLPGHGPATTLGQERIANPFLV